MSRHSAPLSSQRMAFDRYSLAPRTIPAHSATFIPVTRATLTRPDATYSERIAR